MLIIIKLKGDTMAFFFLGPADRSSGE